jgi:hypothetical protein
MDQKNEHLKVWVKNKNKNLIGIAQKILLDMVIKSKNRVKIFLGGGQITKIRTKLYIFFFTSNFFSIFWGGPWPTQVPPPSVIG